jgi:Kdo2-lipid IVA lauroyltransferase/acyltransferase
MKRLTFSKRLQYAGETLAAYALYGFFAALPADTASRLGGFILRRLGPHFGVSKHARANILAAFPEKTDAAREEIFIGMWDNLGRVIAEYPHLPKLAARTEVVGMDYLDALQASNTGAIFFSGHLGNWEIAPVACKRNGLQLTVVYRKPNNPWVDRLLRHARGSGTEGQIEKGPQGARKILSALRKGRCVGMLVDQKMGEGVPVPFFGRAAMTAPAVTQLPLRLGCQLYPLRIERLRGPHFRVTIYPAMKLESTDDAEADSLRTLHEVNAMLESWVRERPEQWLWTHKRWG